MEKEWVIKIQGQFMKLHRVIFPIMIIYFFLERFIFNTSVGIIPALFLLIFLIIEAVISSLKKDTEIGFLIWRYLEGMVACFFMLNYLCFECKEVVEWQL